MIRHRLAVFSSALLFVAACEKVSVGRAPPPPPVRPPPVQPAANAGIPSLPIQLPGLPGVPAPAGNGTNTGGGIQIPGLPGNLPFPFPTAAGTPAPGSSNGNTDRPPTPTNLLPPPPGSVDAAGSFTPMFLRQETQAVFAELVGGLSPEHQSRIVGIPLVIMEDPAEVNAVAGCSRGTRRAYMGITAGLLTIQSGTSELRAADDQVHGGLYERYVSSVAGDVRGHRPVVGPMPGSVPPNVALDAGKLARQRYLFDEQVAFVLGHELAHHYRGHTGCANGGASQGEVGADEIQRALANVVPFFNQPLEIEADEHGVVNVLDVAARRVGGAWSEEGAELAMDFFGRLSTVGVETLLLGFMRTHPPPALRTPIIQMTARNYRGGRRPAENGTIGGLPIPIPLPAGLNLPIPGTH